MGILKRTRMEEIEIQLGAFHHEHMGHHHRVIRRLNRAGCIHCGSDKLVTHIPCGHSLYCVSCTEDYQKRRGSICNACQKPSTIVTVSRTLECEICYEEVPSSDLTETGECRHLICQDCLVKYIRANLRDITMYPLRCPRLNDDQKNTCTSFVSCKLLEKVVHRSDFRSRDNPIKLFKLNTALSMIPVQYRMKCPSHSCGSALNTAILTDANECPFCGTVLCIPCKSLAHSGMTCAQFIQSQSQDISDSRSKACPGCGERVTHYYKEGCHHISCQYCGCDFCYVCLSTTSRPHVNPKTNERCPPFCTDGCGCPVGPTH